MSQDESNQKLTCNQKSEYRVYWPGNPPVPMCEEHMKKANAIASVMGFYLHIEPILQVGEKIIPCPQKISQ